MAKDHRLLTALLLNIPMVFLFIAVLIAGHHQNEKVKNQSANTFTWKLEAITIRGTVSSDTIMYDAIRDVIYTEKLEGKHTNTNYYNGISTYQGQNAIYYVYTDVQAYIVIKTDGDIYVVNAYSKEETVNLYQKIQEQRNQ